MRKLETLSHRQRELTPLPMAEYLVARVRELTGAYFVAALFVRADSPYRQLAGVDCWGREEDAMRYDGCSPIVAHPACGPWGKYNHVCIHQDYRHGIRAMELVHRFGGVVEQPVGSSLFRAYGRKDAVMEVINQSSYGHMAQKATLLYWCRP